MLTDPLKLSRVVNKALYKMSVEKTARNGTVLRSSKYDVPKDSNAGSVSENGENPDKVVPGS
jgi:hypothetical protein